MRKKVKKLVSVNIPDYGKLRIALLENGIILAGGTVYLNTSDTRAYTVSFDE